MAVCQVAAQFWVAMRLLVNSSPVVASVVYAEAMCPGEGPVQPAFFASVS